MAEELKKNQETSHANNKLDKASIASRNKIVKEHNQNEQGKSRNKYCKLNGKLFHAAIIFFT
jgi:hypothetical protein